MTDDVLWRPHPGPQTQFLAAPEFEVLYGGAAGCAKTAALLMCPLRYVDQPDHHAAIFRRSYPEIEEMVTESQPIYRALQGRWLASKRQWRFPSGARVTFGNLEGIADAYRYHGSQFTMLLFDELASWPTDEAFIYLQSRLRKRESSACRLMIRSSCNPTGPGKAWIMRRYGIGPDGSAKRIKDPNTGRIRRFIPGKIGDNPSLAGGEYQKTLSALPPAKRAALRDGRWDAMEGQFFMHLPIHEFKIQPHWHFYGGFDHGFVHKTAFVLCAEDDDGHFYVIDVHERSRTPIAIHAELIKAMLARYELTIDDLYGIAAGHDVFATRHESGTIADSYAEREIYLERAYIDRINGWQKLLELFGDPDSGIESRLSVHPRCRRLIEALSVLQHDEKRPEDVAKLNLPANDPDGISDDEVDALRYCVMAMQRGRATIGKFRL